jgi:hypothetical protein
MSERPHLSASLRRPVSPVPLAATATRSPWPSLPLSSPVSKFKIHQAHTQTHTAPALLCSLLEPSASSSRNPARSSIEKSSVRVGRRRAQERGESIRSRPALVASRPPSLLLLFLSLCSRPVLCCSVAAHLSFGGREAERSRLRSSFGKDARYVSSSRLVLVFR